MSIRQRAPETEFILTQCEAAGLIYQGDLAEHLPDRAALPHLRVCFVVGEGPGVAFSELMTPSAAPSVEIGEEDIFALLYTSGTTGQPKGRNAHRTSAPCIRCCISSTVSGCATAKCRCLRFPLRTSPALVAIILTMLRVGGTTVMMPAFKARNFLEIAARERMTLRADRARRCTIFACSIRSSASSTCRRGASAALAVRRCHPRRSSGSAKRFCRSSTLAQYLRIDRNNIARDHDGTGRSRDAVRTPSASHCPALTSW